MTAQLQNPVTFLRHLASDQAGFVVRRTETAPAGDDQPLHEAMYRQAPDLYALCGLVDKAQPDQQARILFHVLAHSRVDLPTEVRHLLDRVTAQLLAALQPSHVLSVFLALRRSRANHKHTRRAILRYVLNHPQLEELASERRPTLVHCLEHALGKNVARACARFLDEGEPNDRYVRRHLLRFAHDAERVRKVMVALYRKGAPLVSSRPLVMVRPTAVTMPVEEAPRTITATNRGEIAATLVHIYRGGSNAELNAATQRYVQEATTTLPRFEGTVALVLDASASTQGYGEREFCCISQSQAFRLVLEQCCAKLHVVQVGGAGDLARPDGDTDLASAVLDALDTHADVVALVSDGYENHLQGDLARVVASLPGAGVQTPVVYCHSKFSGKDDLTLRRPAPTLPELEFWHQQDFGEVLWFLFAHARLPKGEAFLRQQLCRRLEVLETEKHSWIAP
jgi:hypothetical protein